MAIAAPAVSIGGTGNTTPEGHAVVSAPRTQSSHARETSTSRPRAHAAQQTAPKYVPPLHGTNPHGQGTLGVLDTAPSNDRPLAGDAKGKESGEDIVVGRARGEQRANGDYHGHITVLALFGDEIVGMDTKEGDNIPDLNPVQREVLDRLCNTEGSQACVRVLSAKSRTGDNFSDNLITIASARLGSGTQSLNLGAGTSRGLIAETTVAPKELIEPLPASVAASCAGSGVGQFGYGTSTVANVTAGGNVVADLVTAVSNTLACPGAAPVVNVSGHVVQLGGTGVPLPAAGCGAGTANTEVQPAPLTPLLLLVCNATDIAEGGGLASEDGNTVDQTAGAGDLPYGVREALTTLLINSTTAPAGTGPLSSTIPVAGLAQNPTTSQVKLTASAAESVAQVPVQPDEPPAPKQPAAPKQPSDTGPVGGSGDRGDRAGDDRGGSPDAGVTGAGGPGEVPAAAAGPASPLDASEAAEADTRLPFTGADLGGLAVGGLVLLTTGVVLRRRLSFGTSRR